MPLPENVEYSSQEGILRARFRGPFVGLDTSASLNNMDMLALRIADNINIEENGSISRRNGYSNLLGADWGARKIRQGLEYVFNFGNSVQIVLFGHAVGGATGALGYLSGGSFAAITDIITTGLSNQKPSLFAFKNSLFFYNGTNDLLYDGATTRQIGITPPVSAPAFNSNINGDLVVGASYLWSYTYYNSTTGAESSPSPISAAQLIPADPNDGVKLNIAPGDATTADTIRVYRTGGNGAILFLDGTTGIAAVTYDSTIGDAGLGKEIELDNTRPGVYGKFKYGRVHENRVHLTGLSTNPNRVHISAIYSEGPHPESFPVQNFTDCESELGIRDVNVGLGVAQDSIIVMKGHSVGRIEKVGIDTTTDSADPVVFQYKELSRSVTSLSHFAGCNVYTDWIWLGKDDIYSTDGNSVRTIGTQIRKTLSTLDFSSPDNLSCFNDLINKRVLFTSKSPNANGEPDWVLVGHYHKYPDYFWTLYRPGDELVEQPGVSAGCLFGTSEFDNVRRTIFGSTAFDGKLYGFDQTYNDAGNPIRFRIRFAPVSYGLDEEEKIAIKDTIIIRGDGTPFSIQALSFYQFSENGTEDEFIALGVNGQLWNNNNWNVNLWASDVPEIVFHNCNRKHFYKQLQIEDATVDKPLTFFGYTSSARPTQWKG